MFSEVWPTRICHGWIGHLVQGRECTFITPRLTPNAALQKMCTNTYLYGPWVRRNSIIQHQYHHYGHPILNIIIISFPASSSAAWWAAAWWATTWWAAYWARSRKLWSERRRPPLASHPLMALPSLPSCDCDWRRRRMGALELAAASLLSPRSLYPQHQNCLWKFVYLENNFLKQRKIVFLRKLNSGWKQSFLNRKVAI